MEGLIETPARVKPHELVRRFQVADGLREILEVLNSDRTLDETLCDISAQASQLLGAQAAAVYRLRRNAPKLVIQAATGLPQSYSPQADIFLAEPKMGPVTAERRPFVHSDLLRERVAPDDPFYVRRRLLVESGFRAILGVPLTVKEELYGVLVLYYAEAREFPADDLSLASTVGEHIALAVENARMRSRAQMAAVAAERDRIARDLHDSVTQTLFSACLIAEILPRLWHKDADEGEKRLGELLDLTRGALAEMRTLLLELHPSSIADAPLCDLIRQLAEGIAARARVPIRLDIDCQCGDLPTDVKVALYRTAQEALNNVARHARASEATVYLRCETPGLSMSIRDDGCGFDTRAVEADHLGLSIMRERTESIGASMEIESAIGEGTSIAIDWRRPT
jgi:signal transduction histidine kinase